MKIQTYSEKLEALEQLRPGDITTLVYELEGDWVFLLGEYRGRRALVTVPGWMVTFRDPSGRSLVLHITEIVSIGG